MRKLLITIAGLIFVTGCAPTVWDRPGTTQAQFNQDNARCRMVARDMAPGDFYAQGSPQFVAGAAVGNVIGTAVAQNVNYRDCMMAVGYTPESPQVTARTQELKSAFEPATNCMKVAYFAPSAEPVRRRSPFNVMELTPAQLSDPAMADGAEIAAMDWLRPQIRQCRASVGDHLAARSPTIGAVVRDQLAANEQLVDALRERRMPWGQYNTRRKEDYAAFANRLQAAMVQ